MKAAADMNKYKLKNMMVLPDEVKAGATKLVQIYPEDLEKEFKEELIQFWELLKTDLFSL